MRRKRYRLEQKPCQPIISLSYWAYHRTLEVLGALKLCTNLRLKYSVFGGDTYLPSPSWKPIMPHGLSTVRMHGAYEHTTQLVADLLCMMVNHSISTLWMSKKPKRGWATISFWRLQTHQGNFCSSSSCGWQIPCAELIWVWILKSVAQKCNCCKANIVYQPDDFYKKIICFFLLQGRQKYMVSGLPLFPTLLGITKWVCLFPVFCSF